MTLNQLQAFLLTAQLGSFTAAAKAMGLTQASVSELVKRLESEFKTELFYRVNQRLQITSAGEDLLSRAEMIVRAAKETERAMHSLHSLEAGTASFGLLKYAAPYSLSDIAQQFHAAHPNLNIRLVGQNSIEVADEVRSGTLEAGLVILPIDTAGLEVTPIIRDEIFYVTAKSERLPKRATSETVANAPMILYDTHKGLDPTRRQLETRAQAEGLKVGTIMELENVESALTLVSKGIGDSYVFEAMMKSKQFPKDLLTTPFYPPLYDTIALIKREGAILSPATKEMVKLAKRSLKRHGIPA